MDFSLHFVSQDWAVDGVFATDGEQSRLVFWIDTKGNLTLASPCCGAQFLRESRCVKCHEPVEEPFSGMTEEALFGSEDYSERAMDALQEWTSIYGLNPLENRLLAHSLLSEVQSFLHEKLGPIYDEETSSVAAEKEAWGRIAQVCEERGLRTFSV